MLVVGFPTGLFAANCYVVAPSAGAAVRRHRSGAGRSARRCTEVLREHRLRPAAVLVTHGHIDHMWSVLPVCGAHDVAAYIHGSDRDRLADPIRNAAT